MTKMQKNRLREVLIPIIVALAVVAGIFVGAFFRQGGGLQMQRQFVQLPGSDNKINRLMTLIERDYIDPVNLDSVTEAVMPMIVGELDPHSVYIPAQDFAEVNEVLDGQFDGIGIVFNMATDTVIVLNVISGGPSEKAGILPGDRVITIGDSLIAGTGRGQDEVIKMFRGKRGTAVDLSIKRAGYDALVPVTVTRGKIPIRSMTAAFQIVPGTAYMKLGSFSRHSNVEIDTALVRLRSQGAEKLILDLRGNGGGFLDQAIKIADGFLPGGKLIVYTENKHGRRVETYSDGKGKFRDMEVAILMDEFSASSSEILAGAVQDNDRGTIIGRRSFGKGLVQEQVPFGDGSAVRLTVARYYTPTGRSIQKPYDDGSEEYGNDFMRRYEHNELFSADSIKFADSLCFTTPGGRTVYGGGGIMPDIFVPLDTTAMTPYYIKVTGGNILYKYALEYSDAHREQINAIATVDELNRILDADSSLLNGLVAYAARQGVRPSRGELELSSGLLTAQLRAYIGRNSPLEDVGYYANIYSEDNVIMSAIRVLNEPD